MLGVFVLALALRGPYLVEIRDIGFFDQPVSDGYVYVQTAGEIGAGNRLAPADFVHAPLYAYVLALIGWGDSPNLLVVRLVQIVLGATACTLLVAACRRFFDWPIALAAGLLVAIYPPAIFFDGLIQKTSLAGLLAALLVYLIALGRERSSWRGWAIGGFVLGLLALTRQNALALTPAVLAAAWLGRTAAGQRARLVGMAACAAGLLLALLPWVLRNRIVTGEFVLTTPNLGQNFAMGNGPESTGTYLPLRRGRSTGEHEQAEWRRDAERALGRALSPREVSDYYLSTAWTWVRAHPADWLGLLHKKWRMVWDAYEAPDTEDYYLYQQHSNLLRALDRVFHFGVLCPLAAAGIALTLADRRKLWFLYAWLLIVALSVAAFVVFGRYRFPLVPVLVMFAAAGIVQTVRRLRRREWRAILVAGILAGGVAWMANRPVDHERRAAPFAYVNHAKALADRRRYDEALAELDKAFALSPDDVDRHLMVGGTLLDMGRFDEARAHYQRAQAGDPTYGGAIRGLGDALVGLGRYAEAAAQFRRALEMDPSDHIARNGLGIVAAREGRFADALAAFERVLRAAPDFAEAHLNLGNTHLAQGRVDEAVAAYERALDVRPHYTDALYNLGVVDARRGRLDSAIARFQQVLEAAPRHRDAQHSLFAALTARGRREEALVLLHTWLAAEPTREDLRRLMAEADEDG